MGSKIDLLRWGKRLLYNLWAQCKMKMQVPCSTAEKKPSVGACPTLCWKHPRNPGATLHITPGRRGGIWDLRGALATATPAWSLGFLVPVPCCSQPRTLSLSWAFLLTLSSHASAPLERFSVPQAALFPEAFLSCLDQFNQLIIPTLLTSSRLAPIALPLNF